ncbi:YkvA family protein [Gloeobacter kilaueensis]|uniref:YkvA family protein n=1 Tax=Gloeobacter kilaueensis TaxID=1416614 RepID=UPI001CB6C680|nr:YkvA family protein [Gloeobacter kilaueensis]
MPTSAREWWRLVRNTVRFYRSERVSGSLKFGVLAVCAAYLLLPTDFITDLIPGLGQLDDLAIIALIHLMAVSWSERRYALGEADHTLIDADGSAR